MVAARPSGSFRFRRNSTVGAAAAEADAHFLKECFVSTADLDDITNPESPKRMIVGRTGTGKTALLTRIRETAEHVIDISPESLSLHYISNSTILQFFQKSGVKLDLFYKLLWRQTFVVELVRHIYNIKDQNAESMFMGIRSLTWSHDKKRKFELLKSHSGSFWMNTEKRVLEATKKTEHDLKAAVPILNSVTLSAEAKFTEEERSEICNRGQEIVNRVRLTDLDEMFVLIKEELAEVDSRPIYYIIIDDLDKEWAEGTLRSQLIDALVETLYDFRKVRQVKILVGLRTDLIERVMRQVGGAGYQEEKVKDLFRDLRWRDSDLMELLDKRIDRLVKDSYTSAIITHRDLLPESIDGMTGIEYMLERTHHRPRDIITFFNYCIQEAESEPTITQQMLKDAEVKYSDDRLKSLQDEWRNDYPDLRSFMMLLKKRKAQFQLGEIDDDILNEFTLTHCTRKNNEQCPLTIWAMELVNDRIPAKEFRARLASVFFSVGAIGLKLETYKSIEWANYDKRSVSVDEINDSTACRIHPMYWRTLGVEPDSKRRKKK